MRDLAEIKRVNKAKNVGDKLGADNGQAHLGRKYRRFEMPSKSPMEKPDPIDPEPVIL
ncbi:MAG TPA: hypothetical protein VIY48_05480 [Candidatus Paceibacterota bacterium]